MNYNTLEKSLDSAILISEGKVLKAKGRIGMIDKILDQMKLSFPEDAPVVYFMKNQHTFKIHVNDIEAAQDSYDNIQKELAKILVHGKNIRKERGHKELLKNFLYDTAMGEGEL